MSIEMERQLVERDPIVDLQANIAETLEAQRQQTIEDRELVAKFSEMEGHEREKFAGSLAMVAAANFAAGDTYDLAKRFDRLYASLSISTYEGHLTCSAVDALLDIAIQGLDHIEAPDIRGEALITLSDARANGLNPVLRKKSEWVENYHVA